MDTDPATTGLRLLAIIRAARDTATDHEFYTFAQRCLFDAIHHHETMWVTEVTKAGLDAARPRRLLSVAELETLMAGPALGTRR